MTATVHASCKGCDKAEKAMKRTTHLQVCRKCGAEWYYKDPSAHWPRRNAKADMAALVRCPAIGAMPYEPSPGGASVATEAEQEAAAVRAEDTARRAEEARQRLALLEAHAHPDGKRFAAIVRYAYGERGPVLDSWESCAVLVAEKFARKGERAAYRRWLDGAEVKMSAADRDRLNPIAFGNALIGIATEAYETGVFKPLVEAPTQSFRERFIGDLAESFERNRERFLAARSTPTIDRGCVDSKPNRKDL